MTRRVLTGYLVSLIVVLATASRAVTIDTFETFQSAASEPPGLELSVSASPAGSLASSRTLSVGGVTTPSYLRIGIEAGRMQFVQGYTQFEIGSASAAWDFSAPVDLTDGGTANGFAVGVFLGTPARAVLTVISDCVTPGCSLAQSSLVLANGAVGSLLFSALEQSLGASDPADLSAVRRVSLDFVPEREPIVGSIDFFGPFGTALVPEPPSLAWLGALGALSLRRRVRIAA